ncbi:unnamed protein product, partial [Fusarium fujikuroi]
SWQKCQTILEKIRDGDAEPDVLPVLDAMEEALQEVVVDPKEIYQLNNEWSSNGHGWTTPAQIRRRQQNNSAAQKASQNLSNPPCRIRKGTRLRAMLSMTESSTILTNPQLNTILKNEPDHDWVETKESEDFGIHGHNSDDEDDSQFP